MKKLNLLLITIIIAANTNAQGVGIGTNTPKAAFNVAENKTVLFGADTSGAGSKMMWIPSKSAFRAGAIGAIQGQPNENPDIWNYDSIGIYSFAAGRQNLAKQYGSVAMGVNNKVNGQNAIALGLSNDIRGSNSFGAGHNNYTTGNNDVAIGFGNRVNNYSSAALGDQNTVNGSVAVSIGHGNVSSESFTNTFGVNNTAAAQSSTAIGQSNEARATGSIVMGLSNISNSYLSTTVGVLNDTIAGSNRDVWVSTDPLFSIGGGQSLSSRKNVLMILKNGKTGLGTNAPEGLLHVKQNSQPTNPQLMLEETQNDYSRISFKNANPGYWNVEAYSKPLLGNNGLAEFNFFYSANGYIFSLRGDGNAVLTGTLLQNSDERLKKNIVPLKNSLNKLMQLNGYTYQWKDTARGKDEQIGLIAQEVEKQFPQLVMTDETGKKSVAYSNMVPVLLQAIKEQQQQIDELKKLVEAKLK